MNLDDYIKSCNTTTDSESIKVLNPTAFKTQLEYFKQMLERDLPEFTLEEILKYDKFSYQLKKIYDWHNVEYLLTAIKLEDETNTTS